MRLDAARNASATAGDAVVSETASDVAVLVVAVDEEQVIARDARRLIGDRAARG